VRREDVYRLLPKLEKRGLIEKLLGTPTKIRATPIKEAIAILIKREEEKASERVTHSSFAVYKWAAFFYLSLMVSCCL
jgi:sugar-specific transcriptional regulator TrmB